MRFLLRRLAMAAVMVSALATPVAAQDFRGSIVGTITDATGGVLPGVTVTITNSETGITQNVVTDAKGLYTVLYLNAGTYSVTAQLSGFKKVVRPGMEVKVGEPTRVDLTLETGVMSETVQVTAETPLLNTTTGISGTTVNAKQIAQLPLGDGTAYMLTRLAPGIVDSSDLHFARPMDNAQPRRHRHQRRAGRQRVLDRRRAESLERARRRVLAAVGRDLAVQGADQRLRRAGRSYGGRDGQPRAQERHERVPLSDRLFQPRSTAARQRRS